MLRTVENEQVGALHEVRDVRVTVQFFLLHVGEDSQKLVVDGLDAGSELFLLEFVVIFIVVLEILDYEVDQHDVFWVGCQVPDQQIEQLIVEIVYLNQVACHHALYLLQLHRRLLQNHPLDLRQQLRLEIERGTVTFEGRVHGESCQPSQVDCDIGVGEEGSEIIVGDGLLFDFPQSLKDFGLGAIVVDLGHLQEMEHPLQILFICLRMKLIHDVVWLQ